MSMDTWAENLTPNDMPTEDTRLIADNLGVEVTLILMNKLSGMNFTVPINGLNSLRNKYLCETYDGTKKSKLILCLECKITEGYLRRLVSRYKLKGLANLCIPAVFFLSIFNDLIDIFTELRPCLF